MGDRLKFAALLAVATLAAGTLGLVVYNYVANDWRLAGNPFDLSVLFGNDDPEVEVDPRTSGWSRSFGDSVRAVAISATGMRVTLRGSSSESIALTISLSGDATDSTRFTTSAFVDSSGTLHVDAQPMGARGNASGSIDLTIPVSTLVTIASNGGDVVVTGVHDQTSIQTVGGSIDLIGMRGTVVCISDTSSIILEGCKLDSARLGTSGRIALSLTEGDVVAEGSTVIAESHFGSLTARASDGIDATILSDSSAIRLTAETGDIRLRVLDASRLAFDVAAGGEIVSDVPFDSLGEGMVTDHTLRVSMNGGGIPAALSAPNGNVEILLFKPGAARVSGVEDRTTVALPAPLLPQSKSRDL